MSRYSLAVNIASVHGDGTVSKKEGGAGKRVTGDANTDDVLLSWDSAKVGSRSALRAIVEQMLANLDSGGFGLT